MFQVDDAFTCVQFLCTFADFRNGQPCSLVVFYCLGPKMNWFPTSKVFTLEISPAWMTSWLTPTKPFVVQATYTVTTVLARWPQEYFAHSMFFIFRFHPTMTASSPGDMLWQSFHLPSPSIPLSHWPVGWRLPLFFLTGQRFQRHLDEYLRQRLRKGTGCRSSFPMHVGQRPKV